MKFTANSTELQRTLSKLGGVIPAKSTMPILENILFQLEKNVLTMTATDLAVSLTVNMQVQGQDDGSLAIPAKRITDTVRSLPDTNAVFTIDMTSNKIKITTDNGEYLLTGESAKEFPQVPPFKGSGTITLEEGALKRIIHRTVFAVSTDELRPAMMGVLFHATTTEMRTVSTDGHRLVRLIHKGAAGSELTKDIVVPAKALAIVSKSMEGSQAVISVSETHIRFSFDNAHLVSRLIDETYPNYESVIPLENDKAMVINRDELISSIRRVGLYASATTHQVRFDISADALQLAAQDIDFGGEAKETLKCTYNGGSLEIGFNSLYLIDMLTHLDNEQVQFNFSSPTRAGIISPVVVNAQEEVMMLVMPVRLNS